MSSIAAIQITAVATVVLAAGAIITAILASAAFRKQSEEVALLGNQLEDQRAVSAQQAKAIALQAEQLEINRQQLAGQQLELSERQRLLERQQANEVDLVVWPAQSLPRQPSFCMALVSNRSNRPIRNVLCRIDSDDNRKSIFMTWLGIQITWDENSETLGTWQTFGGSDHSLVMRGGSTHGFKCDMANVPTWPWHISIRFTDDSDLHWEIDPYLRLKKLDDRSDW
jgi:hypothetical protein